MKKMLLVLMVLAGCGHASSNHRENNTPEQRSRELSGMSLTNLCKLYGNPRTQSETKASVLTEVQRRGFNGCPSTR
ncbi:hypothetical protein [Haematobacter massiliensis]|uniref:hypothetical protein n=1 Tax=Haematobacter massiliensis TaxID=195105 RepID=UPI00103F444D|nr:hypothetical protein [Haematobacter massiliensis]QBJ24121.1 hypothetical protein HmaOT1_07515 [Haematobacter massiliensis]